MNETTAEQLIGQLQWRYAVKRFDPNRKLDDKTWAALEASMILTPSSYGLQPWKFISITSEETKAKLPAISWNQTQPRDCSHMLVLAARRSMDADYVDRYIRSVTETRQLRDGAMDGYRNILVSTVEKMDGHLDWNARQVYIALGQLMVAAALLEVDTCPMEGINRSAYDELLGLNNSDYTSVLGCALGYRHPDDSQAAKVRFSADDLFLRA